MFNLTFYKTFRLLLLVSLDVAVVVFAFYAAFWLRLDTFFPTGFVKAQQIALPWFVGIHLIVFFIGGMYRQVWRYANLNSAILIARNISLAVLITFTCFYLFTNSILPRSIFVLFWFVAFTFITAIRFSWRLWATNPNKFSREKKPRCLIYGAGSSGGLLTEHVLATGSFPYKIVGFLDDDRNKKNRLFKGMPVFGNSSDIATISEKKDISAVIITLHAAPGKTIRRIVKRCHEANLKALMMPDMSTSLGENIFQPRPVAIIDLLKRAPKSIDRNAVNKFLKGRTVLITGAGGSIGSEIVRQVFSASPAHIILFDVSEFALYKIQEEIFLLPQGQIKTQITPVLGSATDKNIVNRTFEKHRPTVVLHAAAYKHVPLIEQNPLEGIQNNILSTKLLTKAACDFDVEKFVLISSDKAVRSKSVMGSSKRICELILLGLHKRNNSRCHFSAVRFGNVLGSSGSVVPKFMEQIQHGGPVTVTHPEMTRFFMLTNEAVGLVLQSAAMSKGGEIFVLEMGQPVNIYEMAQQLIRLAGKEPGKDIEIIFSGLRPGEKLHEQLVEDFENAVLRDDIYLAKSLLVDPDLISVSVDNILKSAESGDASACMSKVEKLISEIAKANSTKEVARKGAISSPVIESTGVEKDFKV